MPGRFRAALRIGLPALLAWVAALAARHMLIEPTVIAQRCDLSPESGGCAARALIIRSFADQGLGWVAFVAGAGALLCTLAALRRAVAATLPEHAATAGERVRDAIATLRAAHRGLVTVALVTGAAGLVLYCFEPAAVGVLLALVAASRPPAIRSQP